MIPLETVRQQVALALAEDLGSGDISALLLPEEAVVTAEILSREPMCLCGSAWSDAAFQSLSKDIVIDWNVSEGTWLAAPAVLCRVTGSARAIVTAERTALNFLQTLSGTATKTRQYVNRIKNTPARILDTRKTLPGLRAAQKYAVVCGGGVNHRLGLYDAFLIKENHIKACGSIAIAVTQARALHPDVLLEVEVETLEELQQALSAKPDRILLDNFTQASLREAVSINKAFGCQLEASGGVTLETLRTIAETGVDFISIGDLTKSVQAIDLSLLIKDMP